jgi:hypothetical protein
MQDLKIKNSWRYNLWDNAEVTIEFDTPRQLMKFINARNSVVNTRSYGYVYIVQMKKIKHSSLEAIVRRINLREYNLELLLEV